MVSNSIFILPIFYKIFRDLFLIFVNLRLFTAKRLLIKSEGTALKFFGERLGMYELDKSFISNGKPTYKHHSKNIYLHWNHASHWTVTLLNKTKIYLIAKT